MLKLGNKRIFHSLDRFGNDDQQGIDVDRRIHSDAHDRLSGALTRGSPSFRELAPDQRRRLPRRGRFVFFGAADGQGAHRNRRKNL